MPYRDLQYRIRIALQEIYSPINFGNDNESGNELDNKIMSQHSDENGREENPDVTDDKIADENELEGEILNMRSNETACNDNLVIADDKVADGNELEDVIFDTSSNENEINGKPNFNEIKFPPKILTKGRPKKSKQLKITAKKPVFFLNYVYY